MKKIIFCLVLHLLFLNVVEAQWQKTSLIANSAIRSLGISTNNNIFAGTASDGLFYSSNNGISWSLTKNGLPIKPIYNITIKDTNIFLNIGDEGGIFLSNNQGLSWRNISNNINVINPYSLIVIDNNIFAGFYFAGLFLSTNNGNSWRSVNNGLDNTITSLCSNGNNIFAGTMKGVFISNNQGVSWIATNNGLSCPWITTLSADKNNIFAGTTSGGFISSDNGNSWKKIDNGLPTNYIRCSLFLKNILLVGTMFSGVFKSENYGKTWSAYNDGIETKAIYSLAYKNDTLFAGTDNGVWKRSLEKNAKKPPLIVDIHSTTKPLRPQHLDTLSVCINTNVEFMAACRYDTLSTYADSVFYDSLARYTWYFGDDSDPITALDLDTVSHRYMTQKGFYVLVKVVDRYGNEQWGRQLIRTAIQPNFNGTQSSAGDQPVCTGKNGDKVQLTGKVKDPVWKFIPEESVIEPRPYQINKITPYNSALLHASFELTDTLENADSLQEVCLFIEHSNMKNLKIQLACPNDTITLKSFGGDTLYLGKPIDDEKQPLALGTPMQYCWSMKSTLGIMNNAVDTVPPGTYLPEESFEQLEHCLLNRHWRLIITDSSTLDNGYIQGWKLNFDDQIYEPLWKYGNHYALDETIWNGSNTSSTRNGEATAQPPLLGENSYVFQATDTLWGCKYDTLIKVNTTKATFEANPLNIHLPGDTEDANVVTVRSTTIWAKEWKWYFVDSDCESEASEDKCSYLKKGKYPIYLKATSEQGCVSTSDTVFVTVEWDDFQLFDYNAFTPNDDGNNDHFLFGSETEMKKLEKFDCKIYNRWGQLVAHLETPQEGAEGWDGKMITGLPAAQGFYYCIMRFKGFNGEESTKEEEKPIVIYLYR